MLAFFSVLSACIGLLGYIPYVRDTCRSNTRPDPIFWGIWAVEYTVLVAAQMQIGATLALFLPASQLVGITIVLALSLRRGRFTITRQKILLVAGILAALIWWWLASAAAFAILLLVAVENSAVVGTIGKVWKEPHSEHLAMWGAACIAGLVGVLALGPNASAILFAYPASLAFMTGIVVAVAIMRRRTFAQE